LPSPTRMSDKFCTSFCISFCHKVVIGHILCALQGCNSSCDTRFYTSAFDSRFLTWLCLTMTRIRHMRSEYDKSSLLGAEFSDELNKMGRWAYTSIIGNKCELSFYCCYLRPSVFKKLTPCKLALTFSNSVTQAPNQHNDIGQ